MQESQWAPTLDRHGDREHVRTTRKSQTRLCAQHELTVVLRGVAQYAPAEPPARLQGDLNVEASELLSVPSIATRE
jgi:hypothetical protein